MLILVMVIVFFLGFFLDFLEITLIVLPVFTPLIIQMDFGDHLAHADIKFWFIILLAVNLQTSFLTPPFGFALFYMKGIAPKEIRIQVQLQTFANAQQLKMTLQSFVATTDN